MKKIFIIVIPIILIIIATVLTIVYVKGTKPSPIDDNVYMNFRLKDGDLVLDMTDETVSFYVETSADLTCDVSYDIDGQMTKKSYSSVEKLLTFSFERQETTYWVENFYIEFKGEKTLELSKSVSILKINNDENPNPDPEPVDPIIIHSSVIENVDEYLTIQSVIDNAIVKDYNYEVKITNNSDNSSIDDETAKNNQIVSITENGLLKIDKTKLKPGSFSLKLATSKNLGQAYGNFETTFEVKEELFITDYQIKALEPLVYIGTEKINLDFSVKYRDYIELTGLVINGEIYSDLSVQSQGDGENKRIIASFEYTLKNKTEAEIINVEAIIFTINGQQTSVVPNNLSLTINFSTVDFNINNIFFDKDAYIDGETINLNFNVLSSAFDINLLIKEIEINGTLVEFNQEVLQEQTNLFYSLVADSNEKMFRISKIKYTLNGIELEQELVFEQELFIVNEPNYVTHNDYISFGYENELIIEFDTNIEYLDNFNFDIFSLNTNNNLIVNDYRVEENKLLINLNSILDQPSNYVLIVNNISAIQTFEDGTQLTINLIKNQEMNFNYSQKIISVTNFEYSPSQQSLIFEINFAGDRELFSNISFVIEFYNNNEFVYEKISTAFKYIEGEIDRFFIIITSTQEFDQVKIKQINLKYNNTPEIINNWINKDVLMPVTKIE